jgi:PAS domain S-box-containing protein
MSEGDSRDEEVRAFLEAIIENIPHLIFVKDARELRFVRLNRASDDILGYRPEELLGKNDFDVFPHDEARFFTEKDREVLTSGRLHEVPEEPVHTRTRGTRYLHTKKVPIDDDDGEPRFLLGISEDITDRKHAEEEMRAARLAAEEANRDVPVRVVGDAVRVQQVLTNLVGNATRFTDAGHVVVRVRRAGAASGSLTLRFEVEDTGLGIPAAALPGLFDRFFQAGTGTSARGGVGLGLMLSKRLVSQMSGTIDVSSTEGKGSVFSFELPFGIPPSDEPPPEPPPAELARLRVLVVEDDAVGARVAELTLKSLGQDVVVVHDGPSALDRARTQRFDVVLMDINLPGESGAEVAASNLRELGECAPRIAALTADASASLRARCVEAASRRG